MYKLRYDNSIGDIDSFDQTPAEYRAAAIKLAKGVAIQQQTQTWITDADGLCVVYYDGRRSNAIHITGRR